MLTLLGYGLVAVLLAVVLFLVASYFLPAGEQIAPVIRDEPIWELPPERALTAEDVTTVRLPVALRGYRFAETDLLLDRLADELRARGTELARLRGTAPPRPTPAAASDTDEPLDADDPVAADGVPAWAARDEEPAPSGRDDAGEPG